MLEVTELLNVALGHAAAEAVAARAPTSERGSGSGR